MRFAYRELLVELVGEQWIRQLSEVEFTERANTVDVLDVNIFGQVRDLLRVKLMPDGRNKDKATNCSQQTDMWVRRQAMKLFYFWVVFAKIFSQKHINLFSI